MVIVLLSSSTVVVSLSSPVVAVLLLSAMAVVSLSSPAVTISLSSSLMVIPRCRPSCRRLAVVGHGHCRAVSSSPWSSPWCRPPWSLSRCHCALGSSSCCRPWGCRLWTVVVPLSLVVMLALSLSYRLLLTNAIAYRACYYLVTHGQLSSLAVSAWSVSRSRTSSIVQLLSVSYN
ncbi:hypothetical protein BD779DRAFT_1530915 [Infundibulicybe gibba]|nr:hypothetical protein BD779DRAFT_1530915 [Infundibulicybe gibba]